MPRAAVFVTLNKNLGKRVLIPREEIIRIAAEGMPSGGGHQEVR